MKTWLCEKCQQMNECEEWELVMACHWCSAVLIRWTPVEYHEFRYDDPRVFVYIRALEGSEDDAHGYLLDGVYHLSHETREQLIVETYSKFGL